MHGTCKQQSNDVKKHKSKTRKGSFCRKCEHKIEPYHIVETHQSGKSYNTYLLVKLWNGGFIQNWTILVVLKALVFGIPYFKKHPHGVPGFYRNQEYSSRADTTPCAPILSCRTPWPQRPSLRICSHFEPALWVGKAPSVTCANVSHWFQTVLEKPKQDLSTP